MANVRARNAAELGAKGIVPGDALRLQAISRSLHRLAEASCNYGLTERQDKREDRLVEEATAIAHRYGLLAYHQGDPRGWNLYMVHPDQLGGYEIGAVYNRGIAVCSQ